MHTTDSTPTTNRRQFLGQLARGSGTLIAGTAVFGQSAPGVHVADDSTIRLALIGCGGRGTGAVMNALKTRDQGPIELYAMADLHQAAMESKLTTIQQARPGQTNVSPDRMFLGFDAYRHAIDCLRPGDVALCTTRAYIRPVHVEYAVQKGINVFMEKPFAPDPAGLHRMLRAGEAATTKGVNILCGLQCRHSPARAALIDQIHDGAIGELSYVQANRLTGRRWMGSQGERSNQLLAQLQFGRASLYWVGSGHMVDNLIHQIDECCWIKDDWPVTCVGMGGREPYSTDCGQNHDTYSMEFTFSDGTKAMCGFRRGLNARTEFATWIHGSKCAAQFSGQTHAATVHMFKDQRTEKDNIVWTPAKDAVSPWQYEWNAFIDSIRNDKPHNEARRAAYADIASLMGRAACHTAQEIKWDDVKNSDFAFVDDLYNLDYESPVPVMPDANGQFPIPGGPGWKEV